MATISLPLTLSPEVLNALEALASTRQEQRDAVLFRRGEPARGVYLIRRGKVVLSFKDDVHRRAGEGSILGLPAMFSGEPFSLTATVAEDCELAFIPRAKIIGFIRQNPTMALHLLEILAAELAALREITHANGAVY